LTVPESKALACHLSWHNLRVSALTL